MNLVALILGLVTERLVTNLLHLREPRWFDTYFDWGFAHLQKLSGVLAYLGAVVLVLLPVIPVLLIVFAFGDSLFGLPYLAFAVLVLLISLGPRDLGEDVDEYCFAVETGDQDKADHAAKALLEKDIPAEPAERQRAIQEAIMVQANNRIFGVVFWFMVLGPAGAWLFRVADLLRRRAAFEAARDEDGVDGLATYLIVVRRVHGVLAWIPARLLALGFALAGSFEDAVSDWRGYYENCADQFFEVSDDVIACAGCGALQTREVPSEVEAARGAMSLVLRTLFVWVFFIAVLTLVGWAT